MAKPILYILVLMTALALTAAGCREETRDDYMAQATKLIHEGNVKGAIVIFKSLLEKNPQDVEVRFELAKAYLEADKPDQAEKEALLLAKLPKPPDRLDLVLGKIKLAQNKPDEALTLLRNFNETVPGSGEAWEYVGRALLSKRDAAQAVEAFQQSLALNPERIKAKLTLIELLLAMKQLPQAKSQLDELLGSHPNHQAGLHLLAQFYSLQNDTPAMLATYSTLVSNYPKDVRARYNEAYLLLGSQGVSPVIEKTAQSLLKEFPNQAEGYKLQGMLDYSRGNYSQAVSNFQQALKLRPELEDHYRLALAYERLGNLETAISELRIVVDNAPNSARARELMANLEMRTNHTNEAIDELEKLLRISPDNAQGKRMLADIFMAKQEFDKSLQLYGSIEDSSNQAVSSHLKMAIILDAKGKSSEAEAEMRKAVELAGDHVEPRIMLASYLSRLNRPDEALAVLDPEKSSGKSAALAYNAKGKILLQQGHVDEALAQMEKAKAEDPDLTATYSNLAQIYILKRDLDKAIDQFRQILARKPKDPGANTAIAVILERAGKLDEAQEHYRNAAESKQLNTYLNLAGFLLHQSKSEEALKVLDQCLQEHKDAVQALVFKARIYSEAKDEAKSLAVIQQIETIDPQLALSERFRIELSAKRWGEAEKVATKLIEGKPSSAESYMPLVLVKEQTGDLPGAEKVLRQAVEKDKSSIAARLKLASTLSSLGKYQESIGYFDEIIAANPKAGAAYAFRGLARQLSGDTATAAKDYEAALSRQSNNPIALNNLALIYAEKPEQASKALEYASSAFALDGNNPAIIDTLGYVMFKNGRITDAVSLLTRASNMAPTDKAIAEHLKMASSAQQ